MKCVSAVASLQSLVLGSTRVQDAGLAQLTALPALTNLSLLAEGITPSGLLVGPPLMYVHQCYNSFTLSVHSSHYCIGSVYKLS